MGKYRQVSLPTKLKSAPKGTKLWSPICGECELNKVKTYGAYPIECITKNYQGSPINILFTAEGEYDDSFENRECVLFPSKENHDWSTFKELKGHKDFKTYEKVIYAFVYGCKEFAHEVWTAGIYSHYDKDLGLHCLVSGTLVSDDKILSYWGNEDKLSKTVE